MAKENVHAELSNALKISQKKGEEDEAYLKRLVGKADKMLDKDWGRLSKATQSWVEDAMDAIDGREDIPLPAGFGDDEPEDEEQEDEEETEVVEEETEVVEEDDEDEAPKRRGRPKGKAAKPEKKAAKGIGKSVKETKAAKPEKKAAKGKKKGNGISGKRARLFSDEQRVTVLVKDNPKHEGKASYDRFELYERGKKGMTVRQALDAGVTSSDLKWDSDHDFIKIE